MTAQQQFTPTEWHFVAIDVQVLKADVSVEDTQDVKRKPS